MLKSKISICIAGKNQCAIDALDFLIKKKKFNLFSLPNDSDTGKNNWQSSFKKFSKSKKIKIVKLSDLCKIKKLFLFSFEYEKITDYREQQKYMNTTIVTKPGIGEAMKKMKSKN